jgi:mannosyltransferase
MAVLGAVCLYATLKSQIPTSRWWAWYALYAMAALTGLYTHYFFPIVLVVTNAIFFLQAAKRNDMGRKIIIWLAVQVGVALAFIPWLSTALRQIVTWPSGAQTFTAGEAPLVILRTLAEGLSAPRGDGAWLALFGLLLILGVIPARIRRADASYYQAPVLLLYLLAPLAVMFALALFKDSFLKFMLIASPPFVLLVAAGITRLSDALTGIGNRAWRFASGNLRNTHYAVWPTHYVSFILPLFLVLLVAFPSIASLQNYYFDPQFARDDYRGIAAVIDALGRAGDAVILDAPGQQEIFSYYYKGSLPVYPLPRQRPADPAATAGELAAMASGHTRMFVVFWATDESDPQQIVESFLNAHAFKADDSWYGNVRLAIYAGSRASEQIAHPLNTRWGDAITLQGYTAGDPAIAAGDVLPLTLFWRAERPILADYKVFVHLLDPRGFVVAQRDSEPVGGSRPTSGWKPNETLADPYGLFIPLGTPPLAYSIEVGLYDPKTGERLRNPSGDDHLLLGTVSVRPSIALRAIPGMQRLDIPWPNGLTLLGYRLDKVGAEGQRAVEFHAGEAVHLVLFWQKTHATTVDGAYSLRIGALDRQTTPTDGLYPITQWSDGEVVRDDQIVWLPMDWEPGVYEMRVDDITVAEVDLR